MIEARDLAGNLSWVESPPAQETRGFGHLKGEAPYMETSIALFGADRRTLESNIPTEKAGTGHTVLRKALL